MKSLPLTACLLAFGACGPEGVETARGRTEDAPARGAVLDPEGASFSVWAPHADQVFVAGSFAQGGQAELARQGDGFVGRVAGARAGDEYWYLIRHGADPIQRKADPRARRMTGEAGAAVLSAPDSYGWQEQGFEPPARAEMVVYELHIPSFYAQPGSTQGTWRSAVDKLDHLASLGINVIEMMPPCENPGTAGWGYGPVGFFAPESGYGTPDDLKTFIDEAHMRGMAVLVDWVPNHMMSGDTPMQFFDGSHVGANGIYSYPDRRGDTWYGPRPNYLEPEVRAWLLDNLAEWLDEYRFDGARVDATITMGRSDVGDLPEAWTLMQECNDQAHGLARPKIMIAEDLQGKPIVTRSAVEGGAGFDAQWDEELYKALRAVVLPGNDRDRDLPWLGRALVESFNGDPFQRVVYIENHDKVLTEREKRLPVAIAPGDADGWSARKRSTLAAAVLLTAPGIPLLFQGQEFLETRPFDFPVPGPIDWTRETRFRGIERMYADLIALRRNARGESRGLTGSSMNLFHLNDDAKVIAYHRWSQGGPLDDVVVLANFGGRSFPSSSQPSGGYRIGLPRAGAWRVRFNSDWSGYSSDFATTRSDDVVATDEDRDGMLFSGAVGIGPYSVIILSQGAGAP